MTLTTLAELDDFELVDSDQDCRGWPVLDATGRQVGTVREMLVNTHSRRVTALVLDSGAQVPAAAVSFEGGRVVVGRAHGNEPAGPAPAESEDFRVVVPVIEEEIRVGKRTIESGGVRVSTRVEAMPVEKSVTLRDEVVHVERRAVDRPVGEADASAFQELTLEVEARSEEVVVDKHARVVGEVVLTKEVTEHQEAIRDTVRRTEVDVEQLDSARAAPGTGN